MNNLGNRFSNLKSMFDQKLGQLHALQERVDFYNNQISILTLKENRSVKASLFLQSLNDSVRSSTIDKISKIVTEAIQSIKDKNLEFTMSLEVKNNQPILEMMILDKLLGQSYDVINSFGGGICDIIAFVLRVSLLAKWTPSLSRVIIADESFKHVSVKDQEKVAEFIKLLCEKLGLQLILVSHSDVITKQAAKVFEVTKEQGISKVEIKNVRP